MNKEIKMVKELKEETGVTILSINTESLETQKESLKVVIAQLDKLDKAIKNDFENEQNRIELKGLKNHLNYYYDTLVELIKKQNKDNNKFESINDYKYVVFMDEKKDIIVIPTTLEREFKANGVYTGQLTELERGIFKESNLKEGQTNYLGCLFDKKHEWENIKSLSNDQLYIAYQEAKVNFRNAIEGSQEEIEADKIFTALSLEVESREDFDWLEYKLEEQEQNKTQLNKETKGCNNMKNVKNIVKSLLVGMVVVVGCLVNGVSVKADINDSNIKDHYTMQDGSIKTVFNNGSYYINSDVEIQNTNWIDNTVTINKDGELYSFYVDNVKGYYLGEQINVTMDNNNEVVDCIVDNEPVIYKNVSVIYADNEVCCIRIGQDVYDFGNDDGSYRVNDKVNIVIQDDKILQVIPCK
jgi:hypothetical protein